MLIILVARNEKEIEGTTDTHQAGQHIAKYIPNRDYSDHSHYLGGQGK